MDWFNEYIVSSYDVADSSFGDSTSGLNVNQDKLVKSDDNSIADLICEGLHVNINDQSRGGARNTKSKQSEHLDDLNAQVATADNTHHSIDGCRTMQRISFENVENESVPKANAVTRSSFDDQKLMKCKIKTDPVKSSTSCRFASCGSYPLRISEGSTENIEYQSTITDTTALPVSEESDTAALLLPEEPDTNLLYSYYACASPERCEERLVKEIKIEPWIDVSELPKTSSGGHRELQLQDLDRNEDLTTESDRDVMCQEYDDGLSDTKPFLAGNKISSRRIHAPFSDLTFTTHVQGPEVSTPGKSDNVINRTDAWQPVVKLEPLSAASSLSAAPTEAAAPTVRTVKQERTYWPEINEKEPQNPLQHVQSCATPGTFVFVNRHSVSFINDIVGLHPFENNSNQLAQNTPQSISNIRLIPAGRVSEQISCTSRNIANAQSEIETIGVKAAVTNTDQFLENSVVTTRSDDGSRPKMNSAMKAAATRKQVKREEGVCDRGLSQNSSTEDPDYEGSDSISSNDDTDASVEDNSEVPHQGGVNSQSSKQGDVPQSRPPEEHNYSVLHRPSQSNPVEVEQGTGETVQGSCVPSNYLIIPGNGPMNNIPQIHPNIPPRYQNTLQRNQTVPQRYQTVLPVYQNVPQRFHTVPQRYQNIPPRYYTIPQIHLHSPQRFHNVPQRFQTVPQRYKILPIRFQTVPQIYQTIPQRCQTVQQRYQNAPQRYSHVPQNIGGPCIPPQNLAHTGPRLLQHTPESITEPRQPVKRVKHKTKAPTIPIQNLSKNKENVIVYKCNICTKDFPKELDLKYHQMYKHQKTFERQKYPCDICKQNFRLKGTMLRHKRILHAPDRKFVCDTCGQMFDDKAKLYVHMENHKKRFKCDICNTHWSTTYNLKTHMLSHTGEKPHKCEVCQQAFSRIDNLKLHLKLMHKDVPRYECKKCNKKFKTNKEKVAHGKQDHPITDKQSQLYIDCKLCGLKVVKRRLGTHERFHKEGKIMKCEQCEKYVKLTKYRYKYHIPGKENKTFTVCHGCFEDYANGFAPENYRVLWLSCKIKKSQS